MIKNKFYKGVLNKVIHNEDEYIRVFHIDEISETKNVLINFKVFKRVSDNEYLPFNFNNIKETNNELYIKLTACLKSEYIALETNEINMFLDSLITYTDKTFSLVSNSLKLISEKSELLIYKEYMGVYYAIISENDIATLYEVEIENDIVGFKYVSDKVVDKILMEDFIKYIREDLELYIRVSVNKVIALTLVSNKRCYMEVSIEENKNIDDNGVLQFDLTTMKFLEPISNEDMQVALKTATEKVEKLADLLIEKKNC